jgi:replicative DNA helicase
MNRQIKPISERSNRGSNNIDLSAYVFGKIPPQSIELEEVVLGACLLEINSVALSIDLLQPDCFYLPVHNLIFDAICDLFKKNKPIDILTVSEKLKSMGKLEEVGGIHYISVLTNKVASTANIEHHCHIIIEKYLGRELIRLSSQAIKESYSDETDILQLLDEISINLLNLRSKNIKNKPVHIEQVANENMAEIKLKAKSDTKQIGIQTGIKSLDQILRGLQPYFYIIGARPSQGKTAFICTLINNVCIENLIPTAMFSLEMTKHSIELRLKTIRTGISYSRLNEGDIHNENEWERLNEETEVIATSPLFIDDASGINVVDLRSKIINLISKFGIKLVLVDYIQRMKSADKSRKDTRETINEISDGLANIAKDLKIPVIALSQLGRSVELTKDKKPSLEHLKESGNLEEDAYGVMFLYRPEYYGIPTFTDDDKEVDSIGKAQVLVAKHRNGKLGDPIINFNKEKMFFSDIETYQPTTLDIKNYSEPTKNNFPKGKESDFNDF